MPETSKDLYNPLKLCDMLLLYSEKTIFRKIKRAALLQLLYTLLIKMICVLIN